MTNETTPVQARHSTYEEFATEFYRKNDYGPTARQAWNAALAPQTSAPKPTGGEALTDGYVQTVPDKCDRIVWRGEYHHLPIKQTSAPATVSEPVAWTLTETLRKAETTTRGYLWFSNPKNSCWTPLYTTPHPIAPATVSELVKRIKGAAEHWAYMERIDNGDAAQIAKQQHSEFVDALATPPTGSAEAAK